MNEDMQQQEHKDNGVLPCVSTRIIKVYNTYPDNGYGSVTECVIAITQGENTIVLQKEDLENLASTMRARFISM